MRRPRVHTTALLLVGLLLAGCGGEDATEAAEPADPGVAATADVAGTPEPTVEAVAPADAGGATEAVAAVGGEGPGAGMDGCPTETTLSATRVSLDFDPVEVLPASTFAGGHFVLDLDGSGFGPTLGGVLTTDPAADPMALGEAWADPETPPEGQFHVSVLLEGPAEGETTFPLGVYDVTFTDDVFAPTEGMGLSSLQLQNPDGSANPMNRDNQLELTHIGDGVVCGTISPTGREPEPSNPVIEVAGSFAATLAEQP